MKTNFEALFAKRTIGGEELYRLKQGHCLTIVKRFFDHIESLDFRSALSQSKTLQYANTRVNVGVIEDEYFDGTEYCSQYYLFLK